MPIPLFAGLNWMCRSRNKPSGLNKLAVAEVYIKAGKPQKAIKVLLSPEPGPRQDPKAEKQLADKLISQFPDWASMSDDVSIDTSARCNL